MLTNAILEYAIKMKKIVEVISANADNSWLFNCFESYNDDNSSELRNRMIDYYEENEDFLLKNYSNHFKNATECKELIDKHKTNNKTWGCSMCFRILTLMLNVNAIVYSVYGGITRLSPENYKSPNT